MRKLPIILLSILLTGCATTDYNQIDSVNGHIKAEVAKTDYTPIVKSIATIAILAVVANELGDKQHKSKCNNRAGFYTVNGQIYTCQ